MIDASPVGDLTFLVTEYGQPFSTKGLRNKMREWCNKAGLPHCSGMAWAKPDDHGGRK